MSESFKVRHLAVKQFAAFEEAEFDFCPGINVLFGDNGMGKSLLLKTIYAFLSIFLTRDGRRINSELLHLFPDPFATHIQDMFRISAIEQLVRFDPQVIDRRATVVMATDVVDFRLKIFTNQADPISVSIDPPDRSPDPLAVVHFSPQDILSIYDQVIAETDATDLGCDRICHDLSRSLNGLPLSGAELKAVASVLDFLKRIINGEDGAKDDVVFRQNGRFYFTMPEGTLDVHLVGSGYRKAATLYYLLRNGSLRPGGALLWDEPEADLCPEMAVKMVHVLKQLAAAGIQVFIATHNFLMIHELSHMAEYPSKTKVPIRFFSLHRPDRSTGVSVEAADAISDIRRNPILEQYAAHYDRESALFFRGNVRTGAYTGNA